VKATVLFAGMGGSTLGVAQAGCTDVVGIENDPVAAVLHDHVCAPHGTFLGDIAGLDPLAPAWADSELLWASPPCQPFSQAGLRRGFEDPRAHLIFEVPRWVHAIRPRYVVCEQVKAALPWWEAFAADFEHLGYSTWTGLLHAEQYGVPQTRTRAFLLASLDPTPVTPPPPTHRRYHSRGAPMRPDDAHLEPYVAMRDVIELHDADLVGFARGVDDPPRSAASYIDVDGELMRRRDLRASDEPALTVTSKGRSWSVNTGRDWKPGESRDTAQQRDAEHPAPTLTSDSSKGWLLTGRQSKATVRAHDQPGPTITAGHDISQWKLGTRLLSVADGLALQSFPRDCLEGVAVTKTAAFKAIGNAVPPLWAQAIVTHLTKGAP
jgi:DNA (cytosine-5)-methyltransferase 1